MLKFSKYHKNEWIISFIWILLWFSLGTHMSETFNINNYYFPSVNFFRANLIFYIFLILLGYFFYYRERSEYLIFALYPILGFFGYLLNSNESIYFGLHNSISLLVLALLINFISCKNIDKKLIFYYFHYSSILILIVFLILFIGPDLINKILSSNSGARGENIIDIIFAKNITFHIPQNSNGASRIIFVLTILLCCLYNSFLKNRFTGLTIFFLIVISILASINIFYQSKLNILAFIICCFYIFLSNKNYKNKLKIISLVLLIILPFIINYAYQKYYNKNYNFLQDNRIFSKHEGFLLFKNNSVKNSDINVVLPCVTNNNSIDRFFGGRICGWEILAKLYFENFKIFGYGFFEDRKTLKNFEKISSNSYIFVLFNSGILSFFILIIFYAKIFIKVIKNVLILKKSKTKVSATNEFYTILTSYLIVRSFFEDTLAFMSVDLLLMVVCISYFNFFFDISKNLSKRTL